MLSLIICSVNQGYLQQVKENISSTIGVDYELLVWDNSQQQKGLCEIYNDTAAKAKFSYLIFLHEDILFETNDWGKIIMKIFAENPEAGVIGVAGGKYKSGMYSGWFSGNEDFDCFNITHRIDGVDHKMVQPANDNLKMHEVICVDGVFITCRKEIWNQVKFNEAMLAGFHFYDIDFSLRASLVTKVFVTLEIDIIHITEGGDYGSRWVEAAMLFHEKNKISLPRCTNNSNTNIEIFVAKQWLDFLKKEKVSWRSKVKWIKNQKLFSFPGLYYAIVRFLIYQPLHLSTLHKHTRKIKRRYINQ
jgi:glycosyl transferase family 2